jgi:hypothetical protein
MLSVHSAEPVLANAIEPRKKTAPEYPTAGAGIGVRVFSDRGKRIGPVLSSVEKGQDYLIRWQV